jgi:hypothetical protein
MKSKPVISVVLFAAALALSASACLAETSDISQVGALAKMPIKEVTIFKDGHAFVLHEGKMPADADGNVVMDYLPVPVLGTFWPYCAEKDVKLTAVTASQRLVKVDSTALTIRELLAGNIGAQVVIEELPSGTKDDSGAKYEAVIAGLPERSSDEIERISPPNTGPKLPIKGEIIMLKTADGMKALPISKIAEVTFKDKHNPSSSNVEFRNLLKLQLQGVKKDQPVSVGMMYVQKGLRWIPNYKVDIDGKGNAQIKLEATLINELADLEDATANLVIGVPTFSFEGQVDPIALQSNLAQLSQYFQPGSSTGIQFSNAMITQQAAPMAGAYERAAGDSVIARPADLGPELGGSQKSEDLYVFTINHITLKKGQRMVVPVAEYSLKYQDVYTMDVPFAPPHEMQYSQSNQYGGQADRQAEIARLLKSPKVMHKIRLTNDGKYPLTTAPALLLADGRMLAQGMMTYTPVGASVDLPATTAVDVAVKKTDKEVNRVPNAEKWQGDSYARVDLEGTITLTNHKDQAILVEVSRQVVGNAKTADNDGVVQMVNVMEDDSIAQDARPYWWPWYNWPNWWAHFNGMGCIKWNVKLEAGKSVDLNYTWDYYWR